MDRKREIDPHIGQRLKEYREHRRMTVRQLAEAAHVTPGLISHYENGYHRISQERISDFARILHIRPGDLYQCPGSPLRHNRVRSHGMIAAMIANLAASMMPRRTVAAPANDVFALTAAVAVALAADAAKGSDGDISNLTISGDDSAVDISALSKSESSVGTVQTWHSMAETVTDYARSEVVESKLEIVDFAAPQMETFKVDAEAAHQFDSSVDAANAFLSQSPVPETGASAMNGVNTDGSPATTTIVSATSEQTSTEKTQSNGDHLELKPNQAVTALKVDYFDNFKFADDNKSHPEKASLDDAGDDRPGKASHDDNSDSGKASHDNAAVILAKDDDDGDPGKASHDHGKASHDDGNSQHGKASDNAAIVASQDHGTGPDKTDNDGHGKASHGNDNHPDKASHDPGHVAVTSDATSDQFIFAKHSAHDAKPDINQTDPAVTDIHHLLHTAHDANAHDTNHTAAPQDMTKVHLEHHHGDFHLA